MNTLGFILLSIFVTCFVVYFIIYFIYYYKYKLKYKKINTNIVVNENNFKYKDILYKIANELAVFDFIETINVNYINMDSFVSSEYKGAFYDYKVDFVIKCKNGFTKTLYINIITHNDTITIKYLRNYKVNEYFIMYKIEYYSFINDIRSTINKFYQNELKQFIVKPDKIIKFIEKL